MYSVVPGVKNRTGYVRGKGMMVAVRGIIRIGCDIRAGAGAQSVKELVLEDGDAEEGGEIRESGEEHGWERERPSKGPEVRRSL